MSDPHSSSPSSLFGSSLLDQSKAHPGNIDLSIFQPKSKPAGQGTTSSDYLQKTREDNPEPEASDKAKAKVQLSNCKFETPADQLVVSEPFEMSCEIKAIGSDAPTKLRVTFRMFVSYENDKGAMVKEDLKANWDGFLEAKTESQTVKAKGKCLFRPNAPLGTKLQYKLVAEHMEAADKAESPMVEVVAKIQVQSESLTDDQFLSDGIVPLLHTDERLPAILAQAIGASMSKGPVGEEGTLLIQGHLPFGAKDGVDRSDLRARMIKALLEKDSNSWATLAVMHGTESEFIQNLSALAKLGWDCDPSTDKTAAHAGFKQEVKARYGMAIQEPAIGVASWKALHRAFLEGVQVKLGEDASKPPAWKIPKFNPATKGVFGWGANAPAAGGPTGRTVDLCLYYGKNPGILPVTLGTQPSLAKNCLEDPAKVSKTPMPSAKGGGKGTVGAEKASMPEPLPGEAPWMEFAIAEAKRWKGAKEDVISKSINYHKEIGVPIDAMVGTSQAWCASFANYCFKQSGYKIATPNPQRAVGFYAAVDFSEITEPQYGCVVIWENKHAGFVVGKSKSNGVVAIGGNTSDTIKYAPYNGLLRYFIPKKYLPNQKSELKICSAGSLNKSIGIGDSNPNETIRTR